MTRIHDSATCTCGLNGKRCEMCQFAEEVDPESPYKTPEPENQPAGFLVPEAENVSQGDSGAGMTTCRACGASGRGGGLGGVCPYCHGSGQVETYEARQQRLAITIPTFEQEWQDAPKWTTRTTEEISANYWFIRGQHAKEVELLAGMNLDLREMVRVARERVSR